MTYTEKKIYIKSSKNHGLLDVKMNQGELQPCFAGLPSLTSTMALHLQWQEQMKELSLSCRPSLLWSLKRLVDKGTVCQTEVDK